MAANAVYLSNRPNALSHNFKRQNMFIVLSRQQPFFTKCDKTAVFGPLIGMDILSLDP